MISGGNATVFVSNMDAAVHFYTDVLGLKLTDRLAITGRPSMQEEFSLLACILPVQSIRRREQKARSQLDWRSTSRFRTWSSGCRRRESTLTGQS
jgi:catechol 2,3-dioxygenase-like lactoylglutathione lyase family enzyme